MEIRSLPYVDIQHDAQAVFDDVEQGIVTQEDLWVSGYQAGSSSVHGKARVSCKDGGGSEVLCRDGVQLNRRSKAHFQASVPALAIKNVNIRFPRQVVHPPFKKATPTAAPLHLNSLSHCPTSQHIVVGGQDGFCLILSTAPDSKPEDAVRLVGHVGDVLDTKWFPSGEVVLTCSADLSIRVWGKDGINPRTLKGHTRGVTSIDIIGVGKEVVSGSNDGTVRAWEVGSAKETRKWETEGRKAVKTLSIIEDRRSLDALGLNNEERAILAATADDVEILEWSPDISTPRRIPLSVSSNLVTMAISDELGLLVTGHTNGVIAIRRLKTFDQAIFVRRNESPIFSLHFDGEDLLVGTAAGLPCRLGIQVSDDEIHVRVKEELAGWEAVGVESFDSGKDDVWCAGGEGGIRRY